MFYTYAHYTPKGELFYIGKGRRPDRAYNFFNRNVFWNRVVKKYGPPTVELLAKWETESEAFEHEKFLISCFRSIGARLCNLTDGGEGQTGRTPWNKGIPCSSSVKEKISAARAGIPAHNKGKPLAKETKEKLRNVMLGRTSWSKGKSFTAAHREKISQLKTGNLNCLRYRIVGTNVETGEMQVFVGAKALRAAGFTHNAVYLCIAGKRKTHKRHTWHKEPLEVA